MANDSLLTKGKRRKLLDIIYRKERSQEVPGLSPEEATVSFNLFYNVAEVEVSKLTICDLIRTDICMAQLLMLGQAEETKKTIYKHIIDSLIEQLKKTYQEIDPQDAQAEDIEEYWQYIAKQLKNSITLCYNKVELEDVMSVQLLYLYIHDCLKKAIKSLTSNAVLALDVDKLKRKIWENHAAVRKALVFRLGFGNNQQILDATEAAWKRIAAKTLDLFNVVASRPRVAKNKVIFGAGLAMLGAWVLPMLGNYLNLEVLTGWVGVTSGVLGGLLTNQCFGPPYRYRDLTVEKKHFLLRKAVWETEQRHLTDRQLRDIIKNNDAVVIYTYINNGVAIYLTKLIEQQSLKYKRLKITTPQSIEIPVYTRFTFPHTHGLRETYSSQAYLQEMGFTKEEIAKLRSVKQESTDNKNVAVIDEQEFKWFAGKITSKTADVLRWNSNSGGTKYLYLADVTLREQFVDAGYGASTTDMLKKFKEVATRICEGKRAAYRKIPPVTRTVSVNGVEEEIVFDHELRIKGHTSQREGHERIAVGKLWDSTRNKVLHIACWLLPKGLTGDQATQRSYQDATTKIRLKL